MSESIGARLRQARELRRLTIQQVSETTKLRTYYLQALENDDYTAIPSAAQARGFLRLYAEFLQLDLAELIPPAAPAASAGPTVAPADEPRARPSFWTGLRQRFAPRTSDRKSGAVSPASDQALVSPDSTDLATTAEVPAAAVTDTQTTKRVKPSSPALKKNVVK